MKVLVGYDGSDCANDAVADLMHAGLPHSVEAVVLSAAEQWSWSPADAVAHRDESDVAVDAPPQAGTLLRQSSLTLERGVELLRGLFPHWRVTGETAGGLPVRAILRRAEEWKPDLVVLGSHGRSRLGRFLLGSVSLAVLSHSASPVRIGRRSRRAAGAPLRIIVGIDGSPDSRRAVDVVASRRWNEGTTIRVIGVLDIRQFLPIGDLSLALAHELAELERIDRERIYHAVEGARSELTAAGLSAVDALIDGDPRTVLVDEGTEWGADLIVLGARGVSGLQRFVLGTVSYAVAARARCSVEVARSEQSGMTEVS